MLPAQGRGARGAQRDLGAQRRCCVRARELVVEVRGLGEHPGVQVDVVVLGVTGRNFAAGMSGGVAYVFDEANCFAAHCNLAQVSLELLDAESTLRHQGVSDEELLKALIEQHEKYTGSVQARRILDNWSGLRKHFVKVMPTEYRRVLLEARQAKNVEVA